MTENVTLMTEESAATFEKLKPLITKYATNDVAMELLETYFERPEATPPGTEGFDGLIGRMEKKGMLKQGLLDEHPRGVAAVPFDAGAGHQNPPTSSPPATVSSARSPFAASVCLRNRTAPSTRRLFAPPG